MYRPALVFQWNNHISHYLFLYLSVVWQPNCTFVDLQQAATWKLLNTNLKWVAAINSSLVACAVWRMLLWPLTLQGMNSRQAGSAISFQASICKYVKGCISTGWYTDQLPWKGISMVRSISWEMVLQFLQSLHSGCFPILDVFATAFVNNNLAKVVTGEIWPSGSNNILIEYFSFCPCCAEGTVVIGSGLGEG